MDTRLTIELPAELNRRAQARAEQEGVSLSEVIRKWLEEFAAGAAKVEPSNGHAVTDKKPVQAGSNQRPTAGPEDIKQSLATLARMSELAVEIGKKWPEGVSAADAINDVRRDL